MTDGKKRKSQVKGTSQSRECDWEESRAGGIKSDKGEYWGEGWGLGQGLQGVTRETTRVS